MTTSRRTILRFGIGAAAALRWPLSILQANGLSPLQFSQDDGVVRLNSNENAYGPSPKVDDAIKSAVETANRYPCAQYPSMIERIAGFHHVKPEQVLPGCGSTEILRMAACAFLGSQRQLIQSSPTFGAAEHYARAADSQVISVPLTPGFSHDLPSILARASESSTLVYICNPNNPTATMTPRSDLETFIRKLPLSTYVIIDEAYHHYAGTAGTYASFIDRPLDDERVIVTRTFSKAYGLAGLRLGYAVASPKTIERMRKFASEDNINAIAVQAAGAALDDAEGLSAFVRRNADDRQEFFNQAMARAVKPIDSHANFVMVNTFHPAEAVIEHFRKNNVLIGGPFPSMETYIRVSLGRREEMHAFWRAWDSLPYPKNVMHH